MTIDPHAIRSQDGGVAADPRSFVQLLADAPDQFSRLMRSEIKVVRAEMAEKAGGAAMPAGNAPRCAPPREPQHRRLNSARVEEVGMNVGTIVLIILIILLIGALPTWPYSGGWGYYPSGGLGLVVMILIILLLMGRI